MVIVQLINLLQRNRARFLRPQSIRLIGMVISMKVPNEQKSRGLSNVCVGMCCDYRSARKDFRE